MTEISNAPSSTSQSSAQHIGQQQERGSVKNKDEKQTEQNNSQRLNDLVAEFQNRGINIPSVEDLKELEEMVDHYRAQDQNFTLDDLVRIFENHGMNMGYLREIKKIADNAIGDGVTDLTLDELIRVKNKIDKDWGQRMGFVEQDSEELAVQKLRPTHKISKNTTRFNIQRLMQSLIELIQILQSVAAVAALTLSNDTDAINNYTKALAQISPLTKGQMTFQQGGKDGNDAEKNNSAMMGDANQKLNTMVQYILAYKSQHEDRAKRHQTGISTLKEGSSSIAEFFSSFIDLLRAILQKIFR